MQINDMLIAENDKRSFKEPHRRLIYDEFELQWTLVGSKLAWTSQSRLFEIVVSISS